MTVKLVLEEKVEGLKSGLASGLFAEEIRRSQRYDTELCPKEWRPVIEYIKKNGWDTIEILKNFGERAFNFPVESLGLMTNAYNFVENTRQKLGKGREDVNLELPLVRRLLDDSNLKKIQDDGLRINLFSYDTFEIGDYEEYVCFPLPDKIQGLSFLFIAFEYCHSCNFSPSERAEHEPYEHDSFDRKEIDMEPYVNIWGVPEKSAELHNKREVLKIGRIELKEGLKDITKRRFVYTFGMTPATESEIINALVELNGFPTKSDKDNHKLVYKLKERENLSKLKPTVDAFFIYHQAQEAQKHGLFSDVKVYELLGEEIKVPDPVIAGIDHFGNKYPLIYWRGDTGLKKEDV